MKKVFVKRSEGRAGQFNLPEVGGCGADSSVCSSEEQACDALNSAISDVRMRDAAKRPIIDAMRSDGWEEVDVDVYVHPRFTGHINIGEGVIAYYPATGSEKKGLPLPNYKDYVMFMGGMEKPATEDSQEGSTFFVLVKETKKEGDPFLEYRYLDLLSARAAFFSFKLPAVLVGKGEYNLYGILAMTNLSTADKATVEAQVDLINARPEAATEQASLESDNAVAKKDHPYERYTFNIQVLDSLGMNKGALNLTDVPENVREALAAEIIEYPGNQIQIHDDLYPVETDDGVAGLF